MANENASATTDSKKKSKTNSLDEPSTGQAFILHQLKIPEDANKQNFEVFMLKEIFPLVNTQDSTVDKNGMAADQHFLLDGSVLSDYVWMIRMEYSIHHTPLPTWLNKRAEESYNKVKNKIEEFATLVTTVVMYDVKEWHQRLGIG